MLTAACQQLDRAESLREQIDRDGIPQHGCCLRPARHGGSSSSGSCWLPGME